MLPLVLYIQNRTPVQNQFSPPRLCIMNLRGTRMYKLLLNLFFDGSWKYSILHLAYQLVCLLCQTQR